jgi:hypothetical protein
LRCVQKITNMKNQKCWTLGNQVATLSNISGWALKTCKSDRLLLAIRLERQRGKWLPTRPGIEAWTEKTFAKNIVDSFLASAWPGTELSGKPGKIYVIRFDGGVADMMINVEPSISGWTHNHAPPLPEDICLFRDGDATPNFISCTHEKDMWIIAPVKPAVTGTELSKLSYEKLMIPAASDFCWHFSSK